MNTSHFACLLVGLLIVAQSLQPARGEQGAEPTHEQLVKMGLKASDKDMEWWHDAKFGIFIHWGVGMTRGAPWMNRTDEAYFQGLFANLKKVTKFDAAEWIDVVKAGGGKYVIFLTKQNGYMQRRAGGNFRLWDTKVTDNKITHPQSPFKRDVCKEIADAPTPRASSSSGITVAWWTTACASC